MGDKITEIIYGKRPKPDDLIIKGYMGGRFGDDYKEKVLEPVTERLEKEGAYDDT